MGSYVYNDLVRVTQQFVKDKSLQTNTINVPTPVPNEVDDAISAAVTKHSKQFPIERVIDVDGTGNRLYALPDDWDDTISPGSLSIEYPIDDQTPEPRILDPSMAYIYSTPTGKMLRFSGTMLTNFIPATGEKFRMRYGISHTVTKDPDQATEDTESGTDSDDDTSFFTIPDGDFWAFGKLCASNLAVILASRLAQSGANVGRGDIMNFPQKGDSMLAIAKELLREYQTEISPQDEDLIAAFALGEFEEDPLHRNQRPAFPTDNSNRQYVDIGMGG